MAVFGVFLLVKGARHLPALKALGAALAAVKVLDLDPFGQGVDDRGAHAVQTARDLVTAAAEFAARVQFGVDHLERRDPLFGVDARRDAASVVGDRYAVVGVDLD